MEILIKALHFDITEKLNAFIEKKITKLERVFEDITNVDVQLKVVKPATTMNKDVSLTINVPGTVLFAEKTCDTFEESVDQCVDSMKEQLTKYKEKMRNR